MDADTLAYIGSAIGALGGAAGLVAFSWQLSDRRAARSRRHFPPELHGQLQRALIVGQHLVDHDIDQAWIDQELQPLERELELSQAAMRASSLPRRGGLEDMSTLDLLVGHVSTTRVLAPVRIDQPMTVRDLQRQQDRGRGIVKQATRLLQRAPRPLS